MKKNHVYLRSTFRDIRYSFGRFIAIVLIIFMGVLLFVGIKSVGPNLEQTAENLVEPAKLSDLQVISTGGLTEKDKKIAESIEGTQAELGFSLPYLENSKQLNIQLYSYHEDRQNQLQLMEGKFPKANEVVVDQELKASYPLGTTLSIEDEQLKDGKYKIVGYVRSPIYIDNLERGITTIGDGQLDGFMYLPEEAFQAEAYSILFLSFDDLSKNSFSEEYQRALDKKVEKIETAFATRKKQRRQELQEVALTTIKEQEQELTANEETLTAAQERMEQGRLQLENQQAQLDAQKASISQQVGAELVEAQFADAQQQITQAQEDLENQQAALTKNQEKLAEGKKKISEAKEETAEMATPSYLINNRSSNPGYSEYQSLSDRIDAIANVFPVFFFFIAILITFTTMTRMIEENRKEIGTLKALGIIRPKLRVNTSCMRYWQRH
ncbi:FtsX-like permease family protein [Enterococcus sp. JM9B]|uniref:FtsX-like permease family protein n=1 Tax=Enterococcus sp. JM9B TaxID=1857216 RepID=UPI0013752D86|nr:FtsX-like permease family protein [Enterococcus sp. JM9B]